MTIAAFLNTIRQELGNHHLTVIALVRTPDLREAGRCEWWPTVPDPAAPHTVKFLPPRAQFADVGECLSLRLIGWQQGNKGEAMVDREQIDADDGTLARRKAAEIMRQFP